jgi:2-oxoglutarate ferredoxin oxidoreductase subunit alpha
VETEGTENMDSLVITYGCTYRSARQAVKTAQAQGNKVGLLKLLTIWPFPEAQVEQLTKRVEHVIVPELNLGQLALEVERVGGRRKVCRVNRIDGQMIEPDEILANILALDVNAN